MSEKINSNPTVFAPTKTTARKGLKTSRYLWSDEGEFQSVLAPAVKIDLSTTGEDTDDDDGEDEPIDSAEIFGERV
ncbi:Mitotic spindle-associated MMXD complex subunit MIP18 [Ceratobasidium theobromae]|uniref:Mitotic spindle-associated MMXD complex subunit MIP18 n=1 Tax=Ceratobasidium theobromae TaxID=1582974 RepID=A0A5N5QS38_9AGAM|nr:Mitotic spindle-associated MMXD complex subunit MIP18 [Ceratobasidium theobromae]